MDGAAAVIKRLFDIVGASVLLIICVPIIFACAMLVWLADSAPLFYGQIREGRQGSRFKMWKIRTMRRDADRILVQWLKDNPERQREWDEFRCLRDDPRLIPKVGKTLRRLSLDELPQLWNVLKGEMSLIGPRPLEIETINQFTPETLRLRRTVRPGLTGLWQVSGRSEFDLATLIAIDDEYVRSWSLLLDLRVMLRTPAAIMTGRGAY